MRNPSRFMIAALFTIGLLTVQVLPVQAQCSMMGGGGHDHGASQAPAKKKSATSAKKQRESVAKLLADSQGRMILASSLLEDRDFMWEFIPQIVSAPEWRALVERRLSEAPRDPASALPKAGTAVAYTCPMHPDVVSTQPGECQKCGMELVRRAEVSD